MSRDDVRLIFDCKCQMPHVGHLAGENATRSGKTPNLLIGEPGLPPRQM